MSRLASTAGRLAAGSTTLARHRTARLTAWVARGRRTDLTGWRASLGCWARLLLLAFAVYLLWCVTSAAPNLMWLLTAAWLTAAWRAGKPTPQQALADTPAAPRDEAIRALLLDLMGEASAVHLRTVLAHLQEHGQWEGRTVSDLRAHLEALGIPVHLKVKAPGSKVPTRGVKRADLTPSPASAPVASTAPSTAA
ncbi:hypothetical protein [Streptomyces sp. NPDC050263]|uniref:hypothetical protein n=1 Tax=Streptomyces sp. NPDC050263 TaxID=3155037 RepID=UPI003449774A